MPHVTTVAGWIYIHFGIIMTCSLMCCLLTLLSRKYFLRTPDENGNEHSQANLFYFSWLALTVIVGLVAFISMVASAVIETVILFHRGTLF
jgi:hypothetical protein